MSIQKTSATPVANLIRYRNKRDAEKHRLLQATALLRLFEINNGRSAETMQELMLWQEERPKQGPIDPYKILTSEEIQRAVSEIDG